MIRVLSCKRWNFNWIRLPARVRVQFLSCWERFLGVRQERAGCRGSKSWVALPAKWRRCSKRLRLALTMGWGGNSSPPEDAWPSVAVKGRPRWAMIGTKGFRGFRIGPTTFGIADENWLTDLEIWK